MFADEAHDFSTGVFFLRWHRDVPLATQPPKWLCWRERSPGVYRTAR